MKFKLFLAGMLSAVMYTAPVKAQSYLFRGDNIVSFSPLVLNESGYGSALSWERFLLQDKWLSFIVPVSAVIKENSLNRTNIMLYLNPGIKLYTNLHSYRHIKYSIGPSLVIATGRGMRENYNTPVFVGEQSRFMYGFMVTGGMNLFPTPHVYLGADLGLGMSAVNMYDGVSREAMFLRQLSFKIGYMFYSRQISNPVTE